MSAKWSDSVFSICIEVEVFETCGLDALDFRRRLGLPDGSVVKTRQYPRPANTLYCNVPESFARKHFGRTQTTATATVPVAILSPGDLVATGNFCELPAALPPERIVELWLLAKS